MCTIIKKVQLPALNLANVLGTYSSTFSQTQVDDNYLDARSSGWDRTRWAKLRDEALAKHYSDTTTVHRCVTSFWTKRQDT